MHHVIAHVKEAVKNREVILGAFLDIDGAFDNISFDTTIKADKLMGLEPRSVCALAVCGVAEKLQPGMQEKLWRDLWPDAVHRTGVRSIVSVVKLCFERTHMRTQ
jgi:hypothetical protein